ncbi:hypothetical protein Ahy_A02g006875 [Arachis hypogaea]|uniref:Uncharacterized protein n=1 Tax=Arachis hypogaea TaxID=3818 RepID=A0A445EB48_ARAHY|nr:hypothetical protein Ahy_A02g006875 [Arachis hypogaea]
MMNKFKHLLQEGKVYTIKNLKIEDANALYRPTKDVIEKPHALREEEQEYRVESHVVKKSLKSDK